MTNAAQFALTHGAAILFMWILAQQAGAPIPSAPVLIAVGSLASSRRLGLASSLIATFSACLLANGFWYRVGREGWPEGHRFCRTNGKWQARALKLMRGHSAASMLLAKFVAASNFASLLAGKAGVSLPRFLTYESIGSLTWSGTYIAVGYLFHGHLHWTLVQTLRPLLAARIVVLLARLWRRRSLAHAAILAVATLFFCALRPVSRYKAALRMATAFDSPQLTNKSSRLREWLRQ
jgi:membrane protein DedA with SNARE-associated domain